MTTVHSISRSYIYKHATKLLTSESKEKLLEMRTKGEKITDFFHITHNQVKLKNLFNEIWSDEISKPGATNNLGEIKKTSQNLTNAILKLRSKCASPEEISEFDKKFTLMTVSATDEKTKETFHTAILGFAGSTFAECDLTEVFNADECHLITSNNKYSPLNTTTGRYKINTKFIQFKEDWKKTDGNSTLEKNKYTAVFSRFKQAWQNTTDKTNENLTETIVKLRNAYGNNKEFDSNFKLKLEDNPLKDNQTGKIIHKVILEFAGFEVTKCDLTEEFNKENLYFTKSTNEAEAGEYTINTAFAEFEKAWQNITDKTSKNLIDTIINFRKSYGDKKEFDNNLKLVQKRVPTHNTQTGKDDYKVIVEFAGFEFTACYLPEEFNTYDCHLIKSNKQYAPLDNIAEKYTINTEFIKLKEDWQNTDSDSQLTTNKYTSVFSSFKQAWQNATAKTSKNLTETIINLRNTYGNNKEFDSNFKLKLKKNPIVNNQTSETVPNEVILEFAGFEFAKCDLTEEFNQDIYFIKSTNKNTPVNAQAGEYTINTIFVEFKEAWEATNDKTSENLTNTIINLRNAYINKYNLNGNKYREFDNNLKLFTYSGVDNNTDKIFHKVILEFAGAKFAELELTEEFNQQNFYFTKTNNTNATEFRINSLNTEYVRRVNQSIEIYKEQPPALFSKQFFVDRDRVFLEKINLRTSANVAQSMKDYLFHSSDAIKGETLVNHVKYKGSTFSTENNNYTLTEEQARWVLVLTHQMYRLTIVASLKNIFRNDSIRLTGFHDDFDMEFDISDAASNTVKFKASYTREPENTTRVEIEGHMIFEEGFIEKLVQEEYKVAETGIKNIEINKLYVNERCFEKTPRVVG